MIDVNALDSAQLVAAARAARGRGDVEGLKQAVDVLVRRHPRDPRILVLKGDAMAVQGDLRSAVSFYGAAVTIGHQMQNPPPDVVEDVRRARQLQAEAAERFEQGLRQGLATHGFDPQASSPRFAASLDLMTGRRQVYYQQPRFYLFPGLPQIEFQPPETVPWLKDVEAAAPAIRAELAIILAEPALFAPYIEDRANRPRSDQAGLLGNRDWSAVFLWKDGEPVPEMVERCPKTMQALAQAPLCRIPGRSPSILFSKLAAGTKIPPHHGLINTRLICHLPLVVPDGCHFRVGGETRQWREGQAWAFDDTIEHEARNDSDQDRTILIFDVWKPEITAEEQDLIRALFTTIDASGGATPRLGV